MKEDYSIAIRTLGKAGEKYQKLLNSIKNSSLQPKKIVVVLPDGYELPQERIGNETFVFCPKSMVLQRIEALKHIDTKYTLFLDDDVSFDSSFVEKLLKPLVSNQYDCSTGPLFSFFPQSIAGKIAGTLTASVSVSFFNRDMYVKMLRSSGWSYHKFDTTREQYYPTENFAWTCFMIKTEVMRKLRMEDERIWLERYGYACGDDGTMSYKLVKMGYKACIVANALYEHNDAKTSTSSDQMSNTLPSFCLYYFHIVFWNRFIYGLETNCIRRFQDKVCLTYWKLAMSVYFILKSAKKSNRAMAGAFRDGIRAGEEYILSKDYEMLLPVNRK